MAVAIIAMAILCFPGPSALAGGRYTAETTLLRNQEYVEALLKEVRDARRSVIFSFYLFKVTDARKNEPRLIVAELVKAARRGVEVTVILEKSTDSGDKLNDENRHTAALLAKGGVKVFFDSPGVTSHLKTAVIDSRYVFIGTTTSPKALCSTTTNFRSWSIRRRWLRK